MKNDFWFIFEPQNRLPLKLNRECKVQRGFIDWLYIIALGLFRLLYEREFLILMYCDLLTKSWFPNQLCTLELATIRYLIAGVDRWWLSLSWPIQSDHLSITDRMIPPLWWEHSYGKTQYIPEKQVLVKKTLIQTTTFYRTRCLKETTVYVSCSF